jgi:hypothetical protein
VVRATNFKKAMGPDLFKGEVLLKDQKIGDKLNLETMLALNTRIIPPHL